MKSLPCVKGGGFCRRQKTEGLSFSEDYNPPVSFAASPLCTRGPQKDRYLSRIRKKKFRSSAAHSSFLTPPYTRG